MNSFHLNVCVATLRSRDCSLCPKRGSGGWISKSHVRVAPPIQSTLLTMGNLLILNKNRLGFVHVWHQLTVGGVFPWFKLKCSQAIFQVCYEKSRSFRVSGSAIWNMAEHMMFDQEVNVFPIWHEISCVAMSDGGQVLAPQCLSCRDLLDRCGEEF